jgi:hypothetical protein
MNTSFANKVFRLFFILIFLMGTMAIPGKSTKALGNDPFISILPEEDVIQVLNWPLGVFLMLEIDDPETSQTPDYKTSHIVLGPDNYETIKLGGVFDIQPGHVITVSGGNIVRQHTVTHLTITNIDMDADTISGIANPGSSLFITSNCDANSCARRNVIADEHGNWLANFASVSDPSQGDGVFDIRMASGGTAHEIDEDGDTTKVSWSVNPPTIGVDVNLDRVQGWDWPLGATVSFEIDDPLTSENPDYTNAVTVEVADWDPDLMYFVFYTNEYDLKPGDIVTATDGNLTKQLIVTHFRITSVDLGLDIVYGIADPEQEVRIWTYDPYPRNSPNASRLVTSDSNGNWSANFGIPGDEVSEQVVVDIRNGWGFDSFVGDEDWDETRSMWSVPNPTFDVRANFDVVQGWQWNLDSTITIEIDDLSTQTNPDYTDTAIVGRTDWDPSQTYVWFYLSGVYDIQTGDVVSLSDGEITKTTIVTGLAITDVHLDTDIVEGTAEPNQTINVWTCWDDNFCANRDETADQNGHWSTNFSIPGEQDWEQETADLQPGSWIDSSITDEDSDNTVFGWYVSDIVNAPTADAGPDQTIFAGTTVILDATASSDPDGDALTYAWDLDNDGLYDDASGVTASISFSQVGEHVIGLQVTDAGGLSDTDTVVVTITPWTLKGFYQPVDMNGVYNLVKGGSTVPLKFEIFAGSTELTDIFDVKSLTYVETACDLNAVTDEVELTATGSTSLRYEGGQFIYNWKTPTTAGKCYRVTMMTMDGSSLVAYFKTK